MTAAEVEAAIRAHALQQPGAYEDRPWGHPVFKLPPNRVFVFMSEGEDPVRLTVKRSCARLLTPCVRCNSGRCDL